jgi:hypothetical protein
MIGRREFITVLGGAAAAWPRAARAQKSTGRPLVGLLNPLSATAAAHVVGAFRRGMRDRDYLEGATTSPPACSALPTRRTGVGGKSHKMIDVHQRHP